MLCQTTDSGSNNNTLAATIHKRFLEISEEDGEDYCWDPHCNHIRCFCHKVALIVNAGMAALGISAPPPPLLKESILGVFPIDNNLQTIPEEPDDDLFVQSDLSETSDALNFEDPYDEANITGLTVSEHWYEDEDAVGHAVPPPAPSLPEPSRPHSTKSTLPQTNRTPSNNLNSLLKKVRLCFSGIS